ncbi:hypothetical protein SeMB42_g01092 [Synchytrium endobioticum]|uniref:NmrA-like domain-containing protein n=1 Tax=Synchytrium endobioticum TaxID=286115 RepID=A0A507DPY3_9FUNG|nr:hypothetical protein SeLEV6574_g00246 [Synchytrium endobioticum]TPX52958.1 hypothetical protein SeMB42_g01092 [Synchytrium endobioticum]
MSRKLFVTGGESRTGDCVCEEAFAKDSKWRDFFEEVRTTYTPHLEAVALSNLGVKQYNDIDVAFARVDDWKNMMQGSNIVVMVPEASVHKVKIAETCLQAINECAISDVILISSQGCTQTGHPALAEFMLIEELAKKTLGSTNGRLTILRAAHYYQNLFLYAEEIKDTDTLSLALQPDAQLAMVDVRDVAGVVVRIASMDGGDRIDKKYANRTITLTGPDSLSGGEMVRKMSKVLDKKIEFKHINQAANRELLSLIEGMDDSEIELILEEFELANTGTLGYITHDMDKILGHPGLSFDDWFNEAKDEFVKPEENVPPPQAQPPKASGRKRTERAGDTRRREE